LTSSTWFLITRFGEAQILLPAMLAMVAWLACAKASRLAGVWLACTGAAAVLTTVTKVAFLGWGIGYAPLDFTGISGHAMFAAAILPVLMRCLASAAPPRWQTAALCSGFAFALVVAVSRVTTGAHSVSESLIAFALGGVASLLTLSLAPPPPAYVLPARRVLLAALALWLVVAPAGAPPSTTHGLVTRLSLALSGHSRPHTRIEMLRHYRQETQRSMLPDPMRIGHR
jgi:membrane-associated phospholipid phosphatase